MRKVENYYKLDKADIVLEKGTKIVSYYIECFDRELILLLNDYNLEDDDITKIEKQLDKNYLEWHDDDKFECCEEYMISNLDTYYRNCIIAVIYENDEEDEENE